MKRLGMGLLAGAAVVGVTLGTGGSAYAGESATAPAGIPAVVDDFPGLTVVDDFDFPGCEFGKLHTDGVARDT